MMVEADYNEEDKNNKIKCEHTAVIFNEFLWSFIYHDKKIIPKILACVIKVEKTEKVIGNRNLSKMDLSSFHQ